jgi:MOSC domain-containing protein
MAIVVTGLATAAVKGTRLRTVEQIELGRDGARGDRRFFVIDTRNRMLNGKHVGELSTLVTSYDEQDARLSFTLPDGRVIEDQIELGETVSARFYSISIGGRVLLGPWSEALSELAGQPLRLVQSPVGAVDRGSQGAASLVSRASLARLEQAAQRSSIDARRFRMLIEIDGVTAHEEDRWVGQTVSIGDAQLRFGGHVGRCLVTSRDPDSGEIDLPTLEILGTYRHEIASTEPLPFGVYGRVLREGTITVGDRVTLVE